MVTYLRVSGSKNKRVNLRKLSEVLRHSLMALILDHLWALSNYLNLMKSRSEVISAVALLHVVIE
jgi:hypothetical protein